MPRLRELEPLAKQITGMDVVVAAYDLSDRAAWGTASQPVKGFRLVKLDYSLFDQSRSEISRIFYHELGHLIEGHPGKPLKTAEEYHLREEIADTWADILKSKYGLLPEEFIMQVREILNRRHGNAVTYKYDGDTKAVNGRLVCVSVLEQIADLYSTSPVEISIQALKGTVFECERDCGDIKINLDPSLFGAQSEHLDDFYWTAVGHIERGGLDEADLNPTAKSVAESFGYGKRYMDSKRKSFQRGLQLRKKFMISYSKQYGTKPLIDIVAT